MSLYRKAILAFAGAAVVSYGATLFALWATDPVRASTETIAAGGAVFQRVDDTIVPPADLAGKCVTVDDIKKANVQFQPTYMDLPASDLAAIKAGFLAHDAEWPDSIVSVVLARTGLAPDQVFVYTLDAKGCMVYASHIPLAALVKLFGTAL